MNLLKLSRTSGLAFACGVTLVGCNSSAPSSSPVATGSTPSTKSPTAAPTTPTPPSPPTPDNSGKPPEPPSTETSKTAAAPATGLPDALKNGAYDYYGLGNTSPMDFEMSGDGSGGVTSGSQITKLKEVKDGHAIFEQSRTGGLSKLGTDVLQLDKTGIHVLSTTIAKVDPNNLEFPADPKPGFSWTSHDKVDSDTQHLDLTSKLTIVGVKQIQTKRGPLSALLVTSSGKGTQNGLPVRIDTQMYYAKGLGQVKYLIDTEVNGKHYQITQQVSR